MQNQPRRAPDMQTIVVVGSVNMDMRLSVDRIPRPGETTLTRTELTRSLGGKGANQAVAVRRLGAMASLVAVVGADTLGDEALAALLRAGVETSAVARNNDSPTGIAIVIIEKSGENAIVVDQGANVWTQIDHQNYARLLASADLVLAQLEIPIQIVANALKLARASGKTTVFNAAPVPSKWTQELEEALAATDILILNEVEAEDIAVLRGKSIGSDAGRGLLGAGPRAVIVTRGPKGIDVFEAGRVTRVPAVPANVVDTTGAGDATSAAIVVRIAEGSSVMEAALFGAAAGSWVVQSFGTTEAYGDRQTIQRLSWRSQPKGAQR
jgi:ribokinase